MEKLEIQFESSQGVKRLVKEHYGFDVIWTKSLDGYQDKNYLIKTLESTFVLKIGNPERNYDELQAETDILTSINQQLLEQQKQSDQTNKKLFRCPEVIESSCGDGQKVIPVHLNGERHYLRLITFVQGVLMQKRQVSENMARSLGKAVGTLSKTLLSLKNEVIQERELIWDLKKAMEVRQYENYVTNKQEKEVMRQVFKSFEEKVVPGIPTLRKSLLHGDLNSVNIMVNEESEQVSGILDFGDMVYSCLIFEVAIAMAYAISLAGRPVQIAVAFLEEYNQIMPLTETEVQLLYSCICMRMSMAITLARYHYSAEPWNEYLLWEVKACSKPLNMLLKVGQKHFTKKFKRVCGFE